ncbi:hypothetical protein D3C86_1856760 [compost metagenome]
MVLPALVQMQHGGEGLARQQQIGPDFIGDNRYAIAAAQRHQLRQFVAGPAPARWVMRIAQQQQRGLALFKTRLQMIEVELIALRAEG